MEVHNRNKNKCPEDPQVAVVMVPLPMQGHLNQLLHLAHLIATYGLPVHYAGSATHNQQAKLRILGWDPEISNKIRFHDFQLPPYPATPSDIDPSLPFPAHYYPLFEAATHLRKPVSKLLQVLSTTFRKIIVIHDIALSAVTQDVKFIPNAESYVFVPICGFTFFLNTWEKMGQKPFELDLKDIPKKSLLLKGAVARRFPVLWLISTRHWGLNLVGSITHPG